MSDFNFKNAVFRVASTCEVQRVQLSALPHNPPRGGPQWGVASDDLNATLLSWPQGAGVAYHTNDEVDVVMICVEGEGTVGVDGADFSLQSGDALLIPKGCARSIQSSSPLFRYFSVHKKRRGLMPVVK